MKAWMIGQDSMKGLADPTSWSIWTQHQFLAIAYAQEPIWRGHQPIQRWQQVQYASMSTVDHLSHCIAPPEMHTGVARSSGQKSRNGDA
jgi:hypothetical protein